VVLAAGSFLRDVASEISSVHLVPLFPPDTLGVAPAVGRVIEAVAAR